MKNLVKILLLTGLMAVTLPGAYAQVSVGVDISANIAPPALPVYTQPACPADGYLWQPGYWAYSPNGGYYWVPGVWVAPPNPGYLWTPPYWGFAGGVYGFHRGYWGLHVGFYGGINYGFGYGGEGFWGGRWDGGRFRYNTAVFNVDARYVHNTYVDRTVIRNVTINRYSFNGPGGINRMPNRDEEAAMRERHFGPTSWQMNHQRTAMGDRGQFANFNHGHPTAIAMDKVNGRAFNEQGRFAERAQQQRQDAQIQRTQIKERAQQQRQDDQEKRNLENSRAQQQRQDAQIQRTQQREREQQRQNAQTQRAQQQQREAQHKQQPHPNKEHPGGQ